MPESHWDAQAGKVKDEKAFSDWVNGNAATVAAEQSRKLTLPAPDKYEPTLPSDFKAPEGLTFEINPADPLIGAYRNLAHEFGLDQSQFSKGLGLLAAVRVGEQAELKSLYDKEVSSLGAAGTQRVDAVLRWMDAQGDNAKGLRAALTVAPLASTVKAFEAIMQKIQTQGSASGPGTAHRETEPTKPTPEQWAKMSFPERMDYARKHSSPASTQ